MSRRGIRLAKWFIANMNTTAKTVRLIFNPTAGAIQRAPSLIEQVLAALRMAGLSAEAQATTCAGHATELARQAVAENVDVVLVCGGDGTVNEAAQSLVGTNTALAIFPGGTANVLVQELRLPRTPEKLAALIADGNLRTISVGRAVKPDAGWQRYFLLMAGIGVDATIVQSVNPQLKKRAGIGAYLASGLEFLARLPLTPFSLDFNGKRHESTFTVISNAASYAVWFTLAPEAKLDDDQLDVCVFNSRSRLAYLGYAFLSMLGGQHAHSPGVIYQPADAIKANSNDAALVQLDGEVVGHLPMRFDIVPQSLRVIAPQP